MTLEDFNYYLPPELIAQEPISPRDHSNLLILNRSTGKIAHHKFYEIIDYLTPQDVLVFNDTQVVPARLLGNKEKTGAKTEILLIKPQGQNSFDYSVWPAAWIALGKNLNEGDKVVFSGTLEGRVQAKHNYEIVIEFNQKDDNLKESILSLGKIPLPPYIKKPTNASFSNYQTVYAKKVGAVAAPTAGFHFTQELLDKIKHKGVQIEFLTLHIGLGTFLPVKETTIEEHKMHSEYFILELEVAKRINQAKDLNKRIIAVGTTVVRVLESCAQNGVLFPREGETSLFIFPPYNFQIVDALITNFHLPKSTLLMLVSAFAGLDLIKSAYLEAVEKRYRFFSFGDAMMIV